MNPPATDRLEPGSFRDRDSRVFYRDGGVFRTLSPEGRSAWEKLASTDAYRSFTESGRIVATEAVDANTLKHELIPFVSYPYEWPFGMLRDAALLQLELLATALKEDMVLKDGTPYNVQWKGSRPVFIDIPSFVPLQPGEPWPGYRQFCELCLYPLMLQAYKDVPFHAWLRGSIDGITPEQFRNVMTGLGKFRKGVLLHVVLQAAVQAKMGDTKRDVRRELKDAGFHKELIQANVRKMTKLVAGLTWTPKRSTWSDYAGDNTYGDEERKVKHDVVRRAAMARPRQLAWDLGCNTGEYSRIAAESGAYVVAMDGDHLAVEHLYRSLRDEGATNILPLVMNLADASPGIGWRGAERKTLAERGSPDLVLCLALIHHMVISANIPLREFVGWLADLGGDLVIEFVNREDPMVKTLLRNKEDKYADYDQGVLEECLRERFGSVTSEPVPGGTRVLYTAERRD